jgi:hypothetical protein
MGGSRAAGLAALLVVLAAGPAGAQATRTWVSGVGDDANPCSRTAPCKTFAGAISKTAAAGEINVLDPGGFGGVTITKAITISSEGFEAGVLVSGTHGIVVNAGASDTVVLRGLDIEGLGTGLSGVRFLAGGALHVENCTINGFTQSGIHFVPSGASRLSVEDTVVRNSPGASYAGISILPGAGASARVTLDRVRLLGNTHGLRAAGNTRIVARSCAATGNTGTGFFISPNAQLNLDGCEASANANGVRAFAAGAIVRLANTVVTDNTANGLMIDPGGAIQSFGNNRIAGNGTDGTFSSVLGED